MSIMSDLFHGKISFSTAASEVVSWVEKLLGPAEAAVQPALAEAASDLKQAASDAFGLADTLLGPILGTAAMAVEKAVDTALITAIPAAKSITPDVDAAINHVEQGMVAAIHAQVLAFRAKLTPGPTPAPTPTPPLVAPPLPNNPSTQGH